MVRLYTQKREVFTYLDKHPEITVLGLVRRYPGYKYNTLWRYRDEWRRYNESDSNKLKQYLEVLLIVIKTNMDIMQRLSKKEYQAILDVERIVKTWESPSDWVHEREGE